MRLVTRSGRGGPCSGGGVEDYLETGLGEEFEVGAAAALGHFKEMYSVNIRLD